MTYEIYRYIFIGGAVLAGIIILPMQCGWMNWLMQL